MTQNEITHPSPLLDRSGSLNQTGWSPQPMLDCNLENARFYSLRAFQRFRIKRWDYYAVFTPQRFFSATIADLGYAGNIFVYTLDFTTHELHEEGLVIPLGRGIRLPRNSQEGETFYEGQGVKLRFEAQPGSRSVFVDWPKFHDGRGIHADLRLLQPLEHESMNIVIPIQKKRFYLNRKINCLPVEGNLKYGEVNEKLQPGSALGSLDWGRGVWEYQSFWNWASASGFLPDGRSVGLNLGLGFGDISKATENALILDGCIQKLDQVPFNYTTSEYMKPWRFKDNQSRLDLVFTPFKERIAKTNLGIITSEVHQMFGKYSGKAVTDNGEVLLIKDLIGFAEEHRAKW